MTYALWWIAGAVILSLIEIATVDFTFLMMALGALAAAGASALGATRPVEVAVFVTVSVLLLLLARPWIKKRLGRTVPDVRTNASALVGRTALVLEDVDADGGRIRLAGELWSARSTVRIPKGESARVSSIDGATALVESLAPPSEPNRS